MSKVESADLIIKLYDLRREAKMREARNWFFTFNPKSADDVMTTMMDPEVGAYMRMVISYWEMCASFVNHGAIDAEMFSDTAGEHVMVFAKIEPFLTELRERFQNPKSFYHLEKVILDRPNGKEYLTKTQEWLKSMSEQPASAKSGEATA